MDVCMAEARCKVCYFGKYAPAAHNPSKWGINDTGLDLKNKDLQQQQITERNTSPTAFSSQFCIQPKARICT